MNEEFEPIIPNEALKIDSENVHESQLMQQCFEIVGVFVAAFDLNGDITMINKKASEIMGCPKENILGKNFLEEIVSPEKQKNTRKLFHSIISGDEYPESTEYHLRLCNGERKIVICNNITIRDKQDNISGILISGKDVTGYIRNQKVLQNNIKLYRRLVNNIPNISLFLFNDEFRFIIAEGKEKIYDNHSVKKIEGSYLHDLQNNSLKSIWSSVFRKAITGNTISSEYRLGGNYYSIWAFPLKRGGRKRILGMAIIQNITQQKLKEIRLEKHVDEAEKENREKSDFFARVTHEIRTPLNAIMGFTEQLLQTELDNRQEEYVKIIDKSSDHLVALVNDVLLLSKIDASEIRFEESPFRVETVANYVYNALGNKAKEKGIEFTYYIEESLDRVIIGDPFRLRQILLNLLNNALKFTDDGSVNLNCYLIEESEEKVVVGVDVSDTGIGIKPENIEKIFEQFKQADSNITTKYGGTGLGLTICKKLIEMQNGYLRVSSKVNEGTTFTFAIPYNKGENDLLLPNISEGEIPDLRDKKVLLVDDDSVNRLLGKVILEKLRCLPDIANDGEEAILLIDKNDYDLILLDIHMPGINGLEVAKYIRKKYKDKKPGVIAVTAAVMKDDVTKFYRAGIDDVLIKPYKEFILHNKIGKFLNTKLQTSSSGEMKMVMEKETNHKRYNLSELKKMSGNNQEFINKMITTFIQNSEELINDFNKYLPHQQWEKIGESAHKVLPSYRHLEIEHIVDILTRIKIKTLVNKDYDEVPELVNSAREKIEELLPQLRKEIE